MHFTLPKEITVVFMYVSLTVIIGRALERRKLAGND